MSWHYLPELVAGCWAATYSAGAVSAPSSWTTTRGTPCCIVRWMDVSPRSRSGMTSAPSTGDRGLDGWMSSLAASPVRTSALPAKAPALTGPAPDSGVSLPGSFARWDPDTSSWRTHQHSLLGDLEPFSETWPRWGMMRGGECWERTTPEHLTGETASGFWPTPCAASADQGQNQPDGKRGQTLVGAARGQWWPTPRNNTGPSKDAKHLSLDAAVRLWQTPTVQDANGRDRHTQRDGSTRPSLLGQVMKCPTPSANDWKGSSKAGQRRGQLTDPAMGVIPPGGKLNPTWVEWLMGWPIGWTDCAASAMDKFRQWCASHGKR